jgi:hypothetical protein
MPNIILRVGQQAEFKNRKEHVVSKANIHLTKRLHNTVYAVYSTERNEILILLSFEQSNLLLINLSHEYYIAGLIGQWLLYVNEKQITEKITFH